ncbi:MAG: hypothetical protein JJU45_04330 [Acidimicrobiia bacterium]|nr:hypothetical protein [Acidimicrobiia bacterium]
MTTFAPTAPAAPPTAPTVLTPATLRGQVAAATALLLPGVVVAVVSTVTAEVLFVVAGLAIGITVGIVAQPKKALPLPGAVLAAMAFFGSAAVLMLAATQLPPMPPALDRWPLVVPFLAALAFGLDWHWVERLRAVVLWAGVLAVPALGLGGGYLLAAGVWVVAAVLALAALEADRRATLPRPAHEGRVAPPPERSEPGDVVVALLGAVATALVLALALVMLAELWPSGEDETTDTATEPFDREPVWDVDPTTGLEQRFELDADGSRVVTGPEGERYMAVGDAGGGVIFDEEGNLVANYGEGTATFHGPGGEQLEVALDGDGSMAVTGKDGQRYELRHDDDGTVSVVAEDGSVSDVLEPARDHLYVADPDGRFVIPSEDGSGTVPIPPDWVTRDLLGVQPAGRQVFVGGRGVVRVVDEDGTKRAYRLDDDGRVLVAVADDGGRAVVHQYEYDASGKHRRITRTELATGESTELLYDPYGRMVDGEVVWGTGRHGSAADDLRRGTGESGRAGAGVGGSGAGGSGGGDLGERGRADGSPERGAGPQTGEFDDGAAPDEATAPDEGASEEGSLLWVALLVAAVAVAAAAALWWHRRRRSGVDDAGGLVEGPETPRAWGERVLALLERAGVERGCARRRGETVHDFVATLVVGPLPDERLTGVSDVVAEAIFGPAEPPERVRHEAERVVADVLAQHPVDEQRHTVDGRTPAGTVISGRAPGERAW